MTGYERWRINLSASVCMYVCQSLMTFVKFHFCLNKPCKQGFSLHRATQHGGNLGMSSKSGPIVNTVWTFSQAYYTQLYWLVSVVMQRVWSCLQTASYIIFMFCNLVWCNQFSAHLKLTWTDVQSVAYRSPQKAIDDDTRRTGARNKHMLILYDNW